MEPLILISHGYMPTHPVLEAGYINPSFICPANVTIHYFETPGKAFEKRDAALLTNFLSISNQHSTTTLEHILLQLEDKKFKMPYGSKYYHCRKYTKGEIVPNILFRLEDPNTQLGIFNMKKMLTSPSGASAASTQYSVHYAEFDYIPAAGPQWNIEFDADPEGKVLGKKRIIDSPNGGKKLFEYEQKNNSLQNIVTKSHELLEGTQKIDIIVISCREFISPRFEQARETNQQLLTVEPRIRTDYAKLFTKIGEIFKKFEEQKDCKLSEKDKAEFETAKVMIDNNLHIFVEKSKEVIQNMNIGYEDLKKVVINIALEDNLNTKTIVDLPDDITRYIPDVPGNTKTLRELKSQSKQTGGDYDTYSKIICPVTGKEVDIKSKKGISIINNYSKYYKSK